MTSVELLSRSLRSRRCSKFTGVYILTFADEVVYVGSSTDVEARIGQHSAGSDPRVPRKTFDRAFWIEVPAAVLPHYEGALIRALRPAHSRRAPRDSRHDAEILFGLGLTDELSEGDVAWEPA